MFIVQKSYNPSRSGAKYERPGLRSLELRNRVEFNLSINISSLRDLKGSP